MPPPGAAPSFTVLGGGGFVGSHLVRALTARRAAVWSPLRGQSVLDRPLGHVVYCIGLTADFREKPFATVDAHVCTLANLLEKAEFDSFLYLSSTRVYAGSALGREDAALTVDPNRPEDIFNLSKLTGESLCLSSPRPQVRIARLSNVFGNDFSSDNFLTSLLRDVVVRNRIELRTALDSEKDYVSVDDVVSVLPAISESGTHRVYNVASGVNTTHRDIVGALQRETGCQVDVLPDAPVTRFPPIAVDRIRREFDFHAAPVAPALPALLAEFRRYVQEG